MRHIRKIRDILAPYYGPRPYHNLSHGVRVMNTALELADRCANYGVVASEEVLVWAGLGHDAGLDENPRKYGMRLPEEVSAFLTVGEMRKLGYPENIIRAVSDAIIPTSDKVMPVTTEAKLVRAADLSRMASTYDNYREDYDRLVEEFGFASAWDFFWPNLSAMVQYLWPEIHLTPEYWNINHTSDWHSGVAANIIRNYVTLCAERGEEPKIAIEIGPGRLPISLFRRVQNELIIGVEPRESERKIAAILSVDTAKARGTSPELLLPGTANAMPIPDCVGDVVMANVALRHPDALCPQELLRVLAPQGSVEVVESYEPCDGYGYDVDAAIQGIVEKLPGFNLVSVSHDLEQDGFQCLGVGAFRLILERAR